MMKSNFFVFTLSFCSHDQFSFDFFILWILPVVVVIWFIDDYTAVVAKRVYVFVQFIPNSIY